MGLGLFIVIPYWCYRFYKNDISFLNIQEDYSTVNRPLIKPITQKNKNLINDIMILYIRPILIISLIIALVLIILQFYQ